MLLDVLSYTARAALELWNTTLSHLPPDRWHAIRVIIVCAAFWYLIRWLRMAHCQLRTTRLGGPSRDSFLYGFGKRIIGSEDPGALYEAWAHEYGPAYVVPSTLGSKRIVLCDPKAIGHFYCKDTWSYDHTPFARKSIASFFGKGLLWSNGEDHRRRRKFLTPAFGIAAIRQLTSIFYDSAYKAKGAWDTLVESSKEPENGALIDIQDWMNHISLDIIGLAGFSHNFGALEGKHASVTKIFDTFGASPNPSAVKKGLFLLAQIFPVLVRLPTSRARLIRKFNLVMEEISNELLARTRRELEMGVGGGKGERSIMGLLIKGEDGDSEFRLTKDEVMAQMKVLLLAAYETVSISLTWAFLELSRNPDVQTKLREELLKCDVDPTYDQFSHGLPYLDAVVHETLRLHPPIIEFMRVAVKDDIIPLSEPVRTKSGELVENLTISKGTRITISIQAVNRSAALWGEDAKVFRPSRWLQDVHGEDGIPPKAREIQGYRHLLTFADGPRTCLGKNFAVAEIKAVLAVLVRSFVFELRDGVDSKIEIGRGLLRRPKLSGEEGCELPMCVRPYVG